MSRKKSNWTLVTGVFTVAGIIVIGLMRFSLYYRDDPQRTVFGALLGAALVWGLATCILHRPFGLRLPRKWGQPVCGLLCAASLAYAWNAEGLTQTVFNLLAVILAVVTMIYPIFSVFGDVRPLPKSPPRASFPAPQKPKKKAPRKRSSKRADQPRKGR